MRAASLQTFLATLSAVFAAVSALLEAAIPYTLLREHARTASVLPAGIIP